VTYVLLFVPALVAIACVLLRQRRIDVLAEAAPSAPAVSGDAASAALDALLQALERGPLDERPADELERLAQRVEAAAASLR
jgi:hypothetical protein